jgi:hypothetical protein
MKRILTFQITFTSEGERQIMQAERRRAAELDDIEDEVETILCRELDRMLEAPGCFHVKRFGGL